MIAFYFKKITMIKWLYSSNYEKKIVKKFNCETVVKLRQKSQNWQISITNLDIKAFVIVKLFLQKIILNVELALEPIVIHICKCPQ